MATTKRGGRKPGSGRPKGTLKGRGLVKALTFNPELWEKVEQEAHERGLKPTELVYFLVAEGLRK